MFKTLVVCRLLDPGSEWELHRSWFDRSAMGDLVHVKLLPRDGELYVLARRHEGQYLLRSNLTGGDPAELWRNYIHLVRIEESFRTLKGDLGLRPVFHQLDGRIEAHVFISFLAYCLHVILEQYNKKAATGLSFRSVLARMSEIQMLDVTIPATDGREVRMKRYTKPEKIHCLLLDQLGLTLPSRPFASV